MYTYTTQPQIRKAFWELNPEVSRERIQSFSGCGRRFTTDTRCAFVDFVDYLHRDGQISDKLAFRVTLE